MGKNQVSCFFTHGYHHHHYYCYYY